MAVPAVIAVRTDCAGEILPESRIIGLDIQVDEEGGLKCQVTQLVRFAN